MTPGGRARNTMMLDWMLVAVGLLLLVGGGEALVRGASGVALLARVTPAVVGLTIVAAGTSMPELVVSVQSAIAGNPGIAVGNVVGSSIFNIAAIIGMTAMVRPLRIQGNTVRLEWPVTMLAALQLHLLARDRFVDRLEGGFLLGAMVACHQASQTCYPGLFVQLDAISLHKHIHAILRPSDPPPWRENAVGRPAPVSTRAAVYAIIDARETDSMMAVASRLPLAVLRRRRVGYWRSFEAFLFVVMSHSGPAYAEEASLVPSSPPPAPAVSPEPIPNASLPGAPEGSPEAGAAASEKAEAPAPPLAALPAPAPGAVPPVSPEDLQPTEFAPATALDEAKRRAQSSAEDASDGDWTPAPATSSADLPGQGVRLHDGFYMRFSVGLSYLHGKTHEEGWGGESDWFSSTTIAKGWGPAGDALFGMSATRHLVLGVAFMLDYDASPTATENGKYPLPRDSARRFFAGPFFDVFFDPSLGYHAGGAVGISTYTESYDGNDLDDGDALWLGATAWAGYDVWLLDQWSLGGLVRVSAGRADVADERVTSKSIAILLTVLNH